MSREMGEANVQSEGYLSIMIPYANVEVHAENLWGDA